MIGNTCSGRRAGEVVNEATDGGKVAVEPLFGEATMLFPGNATINLEGSLDWHVVTIPASALILFQMYSTRPSGSDLGGSPTRDLLIRCLSAIRDIEKLIVYFLTKKEKKVNKHFFNF
jgi:hypothetical protein